MAAGDSVKHGNFTFTETSIEGVLVVDVTAYGDERGYFVETYKRPDFVAGGIDCEFVQDNQSSSVKGVLRGLHFQIEHPQSKLVRVVSGEVFDVAVDSSSCRAGSPTASSCFPMSPSSATSATTCTIPTTRAGLCGMIPRSASSGPSWRVWNSC